MAVPLRPPLGLLSPSRMNSPRFGHDRSTSSSSSTTKRRWHGARRKCPLFHRFLLASRRTPAMATLLSIRHNGRHDALRHAVHAATRSAAPFAGTRITSRSKRPPDCSRALDVRPRNKTGGRCGMRRMTAGAAAQKKLRGPAARFRSPPRLFRTLIRLATTPTICTVSVGDVSPLRGCSHVTPDLQSWSPSGMFFWASALARRFSFFDRRDISARKAQRVGDRSPFAYQCALAQTAPSRRS
mmetsp:Transcript_34143/g.105512  ORF Transcript_34143/g.105512 Transcript_34143/m.105512 type:complete len:241 (+) Transcript_34143:942-1664(+)